MKEALIRLGKYTLKRVVFLFLAMIVAVYLTVIIANMGGELDRIREAQIRHEIESMAAMDPDMRRLPLEERSRMVEAMIQSELTRLGMDEPFFPKRSIRYVTTAMSMNLGRAEYMRSDSHSAKVRIILLERLPSTLLLFGTAQLLLFFLTLFLALFLSRRYGSFWDRAIIALAPTSSAPGWFFGIFLILIFASALRDTPLTLPWGGMVDIPPPPPFTLERALSTMKHMILPVTAIVMSAIFAGAYNSRTFFLIYSSEDHVELAKAKGLSSGEVERRYVLRPTLPPIITGFLLMVITMWMGQIVLEAVFNWPGLGQLYYQAILMNDTPVIVGVIVIYGYLLAGTVFFLDFLYALLDPRVRVGLAGK